VHSSVFIIYLLLQSVFKPAALVLVGRKY